jgi:hypothetical protein
MKHNQMTRIGGRRPILAACAVALAFHIGSAATAWGQEAQRIERHRTVQQHTVQRELYRDRTQDDSVQRSGTAGTQPGATGAHRETSYDTPRGRMSDARTTDATNVYRTGTEGRQVEGRRVHRGRVLPWLGSLSDVREDELGTDGSVYRLGTMGTQGPFYESAW